jgi:hypothetical protein
VAIVLVTEIFLPDMVYSLAYVGLSRMASGREILRVAIDFTSKGITTKIANLCA